MPPVSEKQKRFMQAVAHSPSFAKKVGVPMSVGKEFTKKDGGEVKESKAMVKKEVGFMKAKGAPKSMIKHEMAEMKGMKRYQSGGDVTDSSGRKVRDSSGKPIKTIDYSVSRLEETGVRGGGGKAGGVVPQGLKPMKMGAVKTAAPSRDGIAKKGKTRGMEVTMKGSTGMKAGGKVKKMNYGGKC